VRSTYVGHIVSLPCWLRYVVEGCAVAVDERRAMMHTEEVVDGQAAEDGIVQSRCWLAADSPRTSHTDLSTRPVDSSVLLL